MENSGVEIRYIDDKKGRGLFTIKHFAEGDVVLVEEPVVCCQFSWNNTYGYKACDECMSPLETAQENAVRLTGRADIELPFVKECCATAKDSQVACDHCEVQYCSLSCKTKAWDTHHKTLCLGNGEKTKHPLYILNEQWKQMHFPPESNTVMLIPRILATLHQQQQHTAATSHNPLGQFLHFQHSFRSSHDNEQIVHKFLGPAFVNQVSVLRDLLRTAMRSLLRENIALCDDLLSVEGFHALLAMIGTNGQGVGTSAISQWVERCTAAQVTTTLLLSQCQRDELDGYIDHLYEQLEEHTGTEFLNNEGIGLYATQSAANHSCAPNAECQFRDNCSRLSLVALRDIGAGEEVMISYLGECAQGDRGPKRREKLREHYLFVCECERCANDETASEDESSNESSNDDNMDP